jgi:signal transduction histidine kinase/CheY-like chemotaxis protein
MIIVNENQTIRMINNTALDFLLLTRKEDIIGKQINNILPSGIIDSSNSPYSYAFGDGILFKVTNGFHENVLFRREFNTEIESTLMRVFIIFNITYFEKLKTRDQVAHIAKSGLIKAMSSEIFTPINTIRSKFQLFNTVKLSATQKDDLIAIEKSMDLLENLVKVMIDFSSIDAEKVVIENIPYRLRNEINLALEPFKPLASVKNISIITKIKNDVPEKVTGDPFRLRQAISQILENSIENTDKGRILISSEIVDQSQDNIKLKFQIEDTGKELPVDQINEYLNAQSVDELPGKSEFGTTGLRLTIAKQPVELMKGKIWLESPSSISTHPDFPGTKYNFIIEILPDVLYSKNLKFGSVQNLNDIKCLVLSQVNDPEDKNLKLLDQIGIDVKQRIYRNDNLDSIIQYLQDHQKTYHTIVILDRPDSDGFILASKLYDDKLVDLFLILLISSKHKPVNIQRARKYRIDHYLTQPYESYIISEIIKEHFTGISVQSLTTIPKGIKINQNLSILLAEDNLFNRKVNQTLFKSLGFEIDLAQNGNEVIKMVKNKNYDIVFMDLLMPELDGFETAAQLRKMDYKMPIIALTAVENEDAKQQAIKNGINDYLVKPATVEDIRKILLNLFSESV